MDSNEYNGKSERRTHICKQNFGLFVVKKLPCQRTCRHEGLDRVVTSSNPNMTKLSNILMKLSQN